MTEINSDLPGEGRNLGGIGLPGPVLSLVMLVASLAAVVWVAWKAFDAGYPVGAVALPALVGACCGAALVLVLRR